MSGLDERQRIARLRAAPPHASTRHVWAAWQLFVNDPVLALHFLSLRATRGVRPALEPPALSSEGAVRDCWSLGQSQAVELVPAPHSSVAVRHRERRQRAWRQGERGINGGDPRQRGAGRLCRESPLRLRVRRYGPHVGRPAMRGTGDFVAIEGDGPAQAIGRSADRQCRACQSTRADHRAFTSCDVTALDKLSARDDQ